MYIALYLTIDEYLVIYFCNLEDWLVLTTVSLSSCCTYEYK